MVAGGYMPAMPAMPRPPPPTFGSEFTSSHFPSLGGFGSGGQGGQPNTQWSHLKPICDQILLVWTCKVWLRDEIIIKVFNREV